MTSTIKVNNIQNQCGQNIINENSNTITIGASGDTISLAAGASQTGFGRTGTVDWQTSSIKTSTFTAANGEGYFADTSSGGFTMNLPAGSAGNIVSVVDYTNTFQNNNLTISANGSEKIAGSTDDAVLTMEGQSITLVYVDGTEGWKNVQDSTSNVTGANEFVVATVSGSGNTLATAPCCSNTKIATFTGPGTFCVSQAANGAYAPNAVVSYMVIAGGGGGGGSYGGGGGAGGLRELVSPTAPYTGSPLNGYPSSPNRITVTAQGYPITVGAGGAGGSFPAPSYVGATGSNSIFSTIQSAGGGGGADEAEPGINGGSGGGGSYGPDAGGTGNTPPTTPAQGQNGGAGGPAGPHYTNGGGGGAGETGVAGTPSSNGRGGAGVSSSASGSSVSYAGGGGAGGGDTPVCGGAASPCGTGGAGTRKTVSTSGFPGTINTGGGGGGNRSESPGPQTGGNGGSGIVIIRYKFQ